MARSYESGDRTGENILLGQPEGGLSIYTDLDKDPVNGRGNALVPVYMGREKGGDPRLETADSRSARVYSGRVGESSSAQKSKLYRPRRGANPRETW